MAQQTGYTYVTPEQANIFNSLGRLQQGMGLSRDWAILDPTKADPNYGTNPYMNGSVTGYNVPDDSYGRLLRFARDWGGPGARGLPMTGNIDPATGLAPAAPLAPPTQTTGLQTANPTQPNTMKRVYNTAPMNYLTYGMGPEKAFFSNVPDGSSSSGSGGSLVEQLQSILSS
jgi:hypothetical protein